MNISIFLDELNKEKNLEKKLFIYSCFAGSTISIIAMLANMILGFDYLLALSCFSSSIVYLGILYWYKKKYTFKGILLFYITFSISILNVLYFVSGGIDSSFQSFFSMFLVIMLVILRKKYSFIFLVLFILDIVFLYIMEMNFPSLIIKYPNQNLKYIDLLIWVIFTSIFISITLRLFKSTYIRALDDIEIQQNKLSEIEKNLNIERENVEKANQAKSDFLSVMTHEIRTPLNAIVAISNLIEDNNGEIDNKLINSLKTSSDNLLTLVSDILDFSKIQEGKIFLESIPFNLKDTIISIENLYSIKAKERNNKILIDFDESLKNKIVGDSARLTQIITNLISNAIKFTKDGEIKLKIYKEKFDTESKKIKINFSVEDNGIGISKEKQDEIFDKFTQVDASITRKYGGTGLGLSITKKLVELMGGEINVTSSINEGSKFYFSLEFLEIIDNIEVINIDKNIDLSNIKLLLVEDNDVNVMVATKFFDKWKLNYQVAYNGFEAIEKTKNNYFDVILMDLQMPEMDGFTATSKIRQSYVDIPIIALTANASQEIKESCINAGFNDFITKPFKPDILKEKIFKMTSL